jgi:uncharacterized Zn-binding protein involved in type VI secretion
MGVAINPPKTPVTSGSSGIAAATLPNVCKMPGPPAPFVPTPLPNIGKSDNSPQGYSTSVTIGGYAVALAGASFNSTGDVASQGTGGGLISSNVQGLTTFIGPGSMDVKIEGKNVQLLGDQMLNNGAAGSGSPANAATMGGVLQAPGMVVVCSDSEQTIRCAIKKCDEKNAKGKPYPKNTPCKELGTLKHACVHSKLKGKEPEIFSQPLCVMTDPPTMAMSGSNPGATTNLWEAKRLAVAALGRFVKVAQSPSGASLRCPDTIFRDEDGLRVIDAKFPCAGVATWGPGQKQAYEKIVGERRVEAVSPAQVGDEECS